MKVLTIVKEVLLENMNINLSTKDLDRNFSVLGINSVTYAQILALLEDKLNVEFIDDAYNIRVVNSIYKLVKMIEDQLNKI